MSEVEDRAAERLSAVVCAARSAGLVDVVHALHRDVWTQDLARYEPDEMGDTTRSLGFQASENIRKLAEQRFREDPRWAIDGLGVASRQGSLQLTFAGVRLRFMKAGPDHGRNPDWIRLDRGDGEARRLMAERNSLVLGGYRTQPPDPGLFDLDEGDAGEADSLNDFLLVWTGHLQEALTAGWLTVPILGERSFPAQEQLWWDDTSGSPGHGRRTPAAPGGEPFTDKPSPSAALKLRPGMGREGEA
jgi:hypothetical protein